MVFLEKQQFALASELVNIPVTTSTFSVLLKLTTAVLMAGDMALWMGPGRKIIEKSWETPEYGIKLCGSLADLEWGGWKMIAVPSLTKAIPQLLESAYGLVLHLLASLQREGKLWQLDSTCRRVLEEHMCARLGQWEMRDELVSIWFHLRWADLLNKGSVYSRSEGTRAIRLIGTRGAFSLCSASRRARCGNDSSVSRPSSRLQQYLRKFGLDFGCLHAVSRIM